MGLIIIIMFSHIKRIFCCFKKNNSGVYILKLSNGKYYIGESNDIDRRVWMHENSNGSNWTKMYGVIGKMDTIRNNNGNLNELIETLNMINTYGIDNVRGSMFTKVSLNASDKIMAAQLYCELYGLCRKCGGKGHFIGNCTSPEIKAPWVKNFGGCLDFHETLIPSHIRKCTTCTRDISGSPKHFKYCQTCFTKL